jgi:bacteriophage HK97-gp10 putative tail-component
MAKTRTAKSGTLVTVDLSGLRQFATALRKASPELSKDLRLGLKQGGEIVADNARARSSWSKRIPRSIHVRASGLRVSVVAGGARAPEGAPLEHQGQPGFFRHPVFATGDRSTWHWTKPPGQRAHPFLRPAAEAEAPRVAEKVLEAVDKSLSDAGFSQ